MFVIKKVIAILCAFICVLSVGLIGCVPDGDNQTQEVLVIKEVDKFAPCTPQELARWNPKLYAHFEIALLSASIYGGLVYTIDDKTYTQVEIIMMGDLKEGQYQIVIETHEDFVVSEKQADGSYVSKPYYRKAIINVDVSAEYEDKYDSVKNSSAISPQ